MSTGPVVASGDEQLPLADTPRPAGAARRVECRRCHRALTDPDSRLRRIGPDCEHLIAAARRHDIDQNPLPGL